MVTGEKAHGEQAPERRIAGAARVAAIAQAQDREGREHQPGDDVDELQRDHGAALRASLRSSHHRRAP